MSIPLRTRKLGDIAEINPSLTGSLDGDARVSFVPMSAVTADTASTTRGEDRRYSDVSKGYTPFLDGDLLVAKITPCFENGKIAQARLAHRVGFGSTEFHVVRPHAGDADARYLLHFLRQKRIRLDGVRKMTGSAGQRRVPEHFLAGLQVPLPSPDEQRRIAEVLDRTESLRATRRASLAQLDTLTKSIFLDMFGDAAENTRGWPHREVREYVAAFQGGKSIESESDNDALTRHRVLKVSAVTGMTFLPHESKPVPDTYSPPVEHFARPGDLLFSRANTTDLVGAVAYVERTPANLLLPDKLWRFVWKDPPMADPLFVWALFQTHAVRGEISRRATGTSGSMKNISQEKVFGISTILPPLHLQQTFSRRLVSVEKLKAQHTSSLAQLDELFACLQHSAFRGDL